MNHKNKSKLRFARERARKANDFDRLWQSRGGWNCVELHEIPDFDSADREITAANQNLDRLNSKLSITKEIK